MAQKNSHESFGGRLRKWFFIIRPFTLSASVAPVLTGWAVALSITRRLNWPVAVVTLLCAMCLQVLSNLINDYCDFRKGNDDEDRLGPARAISKGEVTSKEMFRAIAIVALLAVGMGCFLVWKGGWPIVAIGITALLFAWLYSATSHSLSHLGVADLFSLSYYGFIASAGTCFLLTGSWMDEALWLGLGCGSIATGILNVNNIRDVEQDAKHGKKTLIVRLGVGFGRVYYACCLLLPVVMLWLTRWRSWWMIAGMGMVAVGLYLLFLRSSGRQYNRILMLTGFFDLVYALIVL